LKNRRKFENEAA
jgi:Asp-tRNA(Asn)/Glu-tRNA(Gln) amidotransferase C subunit